MDVSIISGEIIGWLKQLPLPVQVAIKIICILIISIVVVKVGKFIIRSILEKQKTFKYGINSKKLDTALTLAISIFRYAVYIFAAVSIFTELTDYFKLKSLMAAAGIGGIAIGFGAQSLIKDVISGFFVIMEDQYAVGDSITVNNLTGTVEEMELRVTRLRSFNGDFYIIPNGEIKTVINHTRGSKAVIVDIPIAYSADINKAFEVASTACFNITQEEIVFVEMPKVLGITEMGKYGMNIRIMAATRPNEQWEAERRIRKLVKEEFEKENVPFYEKATIEMARPYQEGGNADA